MDLRHEELIMLSNALNEVLHGPDAIEAWEFEARIGASREGAEGLRSRLSDEIRHTD